MTVPPVRGKALRWARVLRRVLYLLSIILVGYFLWRPYGFGGVIGTLVVALLWYVEIRRGDQTEDYLLENYENPVRD